MADSGQTVLRIGLTGGIASGKTLIANMFSQLGVPVIDTDDIARQVVEPGQPALNEIVTEFGPEVLDASGRLDRGRVREIVFSEESRRARLESILHPRIRELTLAASAAAGGPYQILVVPLLIESGFDSLVDRILVADLPEALQRDRLISRDAETPAQASRMMSAQLSRAQRLEAADDVIDNSGTPEDTRAQVDALHRKYLQICGDAPGRAE